MADDLGLGHAEPPHPLIEAAGFDGLALGEETGQVLELRLQGTVFENTSERLRPAELPGDPAHLGDALLPAQVGLRQPAGVREAGVEAVGLEAFDPCSQRCDRRGRGRGGALEGHNPGDAASEHGGPQREEHHRARRDGRQAAAEIDGSGQRAADLFQNPPQAGDQGIKHEGLLFAGR
ncbi:MAG: hypothetical protein R6V84_13860 [Desulfobacterales bacterium]